MQERTKEHKSDLQFARTETSTERNVDISGKGQGRRVPVDRRAAYTREIMCGLYNTEIARINNTFIRDLRKPRPL